MTRDRSCVYRRVLIATGLLTTVGVISLALISIWLQRKPDPIDTADVIVVLGGDTPARVLTGADLYNAGIAGQVWITGDVVMPGENMSIAWSARQIAWEHGVPFERQVLLATTSTWEDAEQIRAAALARGVHRLLIVTSWYHSRRAMCVIGWQLADLDINIRYYPSTRTQPAPERWLLSPEGWRAVTREILAFGYYWPRYGVSPFSC